MSRPPSPTDVQKERDSSKRRLLGIWASLADRYTRRIDEDDIVDIRTGEIMIDRGFIRKSRKLDFGAIAAPAAGDAIFDEGSDEEEEDEYDLDELDAFADPTDEVDVSEKDLRIKPMPPMTTVSSADAEDLRAFLEAERRRKHLCGSDVEVEEDSDQASDVEHEIVNLISEDDCGSDVEEEEEDKNQASEDVEHEIVDLVSEDELDNWDVDESSIVIPKREHSDVPERHETLRKSPRKRKRTPSDSDHDELPVYIPGSGNSSDSEQEYNRNLSHSHHNNFQPAYHYPYPHYHQSYPPSPQQQQQHHPPRPEMFPPPIPDPRAQFIITQAMHQLSALVGTPWTPPHDPSFIPHTPSRRHQSRRANSIFNTPYHPHPYPYSYDPNLSHATLPPESSPESISSPEKFSSPSGPRKSSMARAGSRSIGRQVSFKIERGRDRVDVYDRDVSPSKPPPRREESPSNRGRERNGDRKSYSRAQTPGPESGLPKGVIIKKRGHNSKRRLKGGDDLDVAA